MITIRDARVTDAARFATLSEELGYPVEQELMSQRLERLLPRPENIVLAAEASSGEVVGWTHAAEQDFLETGRHCEILGLVVAAGQRGRGIGRLMIEQIEQWAAKRRLKQVSVRSNIVRKESHPFYERMGYERIKTQHVYRKMTNHESRLTNHLLDS